jgi:hypothetical protein
MKTTRAGDQVIIQVAGAEIGPLLDQGSVENAIAAEVDLDEEVLGYSISAHHPELTITLKLDIAAPPGESDQEVYRRENGVPLV